MNATWSLLGHMLHCTNWCSFVEFTRCTMKAPWSPDCVSISNRSSIKGTKMVVQNLNIVFTTWLFWYKHLPSTLADISPGFKFYFLTALVERWKRLRFIMGFLHSDNKAFPFSLWLKLRSSRFDLSNCCSYFCLSITCNLTWVCLLKLYNPIYLPWCFLCEWLYMKNLKVLWYIQYISKHLIIVYIYIYTYIFIVFKVYIYILF